MKQATHMVNWDVMLPLKSKPVVYVEFTADCTIEQGCNGPYVQAYKLYLETGFAHKKEAVESEVVLDVPADHALQIILREPFENKNWQKCYDILFAYMVSQQMQKNDILMEDLN